MFQRQKSAIVSSVAGLLLASCSAQDSAVNSTDHSILLKPNHVAFDVPNTFDAVTFAVPETDFAPITVTPYSSSGFETKSEYETIEGYKLRFTQLIEAQAANVETPYAAYHLLGPLVGTGENRETGAIRLTYSVQNQTATFSYNPGDLSRTVMAGSKNPDYPNQYESHSFTIRDIDCVAAESADRNQRQSYLARTEAAFPMARDTAERLQVLGNAKLLAVARLEYDLRDPRYTSEQVLNELAVDPVVHQENVLSQNPQDIVFSMVFGPTQTGTKVTTFEGGRIGTLNYMTHVADLTDLLIVDAQTRQVLFELPVCESQNN